MFNELIVYNANADINTNANTNTNANLMICMALLALLVVTVIFEIIMLYDKIYLLKSQINKLEDKIQSNHTKLIDAHNNNTIRYMEGYEELEEKIKQLEITMDTKVESVIDIAIIKTEKELEEKMQSEYTKWRDTANEDTLVYLQGCAVLEKKMEEKIQTIYDDLFDNIHDVVCDKIYSKMKKAHNGNVQILKEFTDDLEEKFILQTQTVKEMQVRLDKVEEIQLLEEKKYKMQLQKVSQENHKLVQHSSVLFDKTKTMQMQINGINNIVKETDFEYIAVGVANDHGEPYYMHKNITYIYSSGHWTIASGEQFVKKGCKYIILSQLSKMKINKLEIQWLIDTPFKYTPNERHIHLAGDYSVNQLKIEHLRRMYQYLQDLSIEIILPGDQNVKNQILQIVNSSA